MPVYWDAVMRSDDTIAAAEGTYNIRIVIVQNTAAFMYSNLLSETGCDLLIKDTLAV
jgi:hypothetical protein